MASKERRRDGWRVRWRDLAGKAHSRQCPTAKVADQLVREIEATQALGREWAPSAGERIPELAGLIHEHLTAIARTSAQATINSRRSQLGLFLLWCDARGVTHASQLSRALLEQYDADMAARGIRASVRRLAIGIVSRFWEWCADHDQHGDYTPRPRKIAMPARVAEETIAPTYAEADAVVALAREKAPGYPRRGHTYRFVVLLRALGLRSKQTLALEWRDLDARAKTLRIRPELGKSPSERSGRVLPIPSWLATELATWERSAATLVGGKTGSSASSATRILWRAARVGGSPVRPEVYDRRPDHAFRKLLRTELIRAGAHPEAVEYWFGRSTGTRGAYTDPRAHDLVQIARLIPAPRAPLVSREASALAANPRPKRRSA